MLGLHCCSWAFSSCGEQGLLSSFGARASHCSGFSCCRAQALGHRDFSSCGPWVLERGLGSYGTWALLASWHVGSSRIRDQTCVLCTDRQIPDHWTTREAPEQITLKASPYYKLEINKNTWTMRSLTFHLSFFCLLFFILFFHYLSLPFLPRNSNSSASGLVLAYLSDLLI